MKCFLKLLYGILCLIQLCCKVLNTNSINNQNEKNSFHLKNYINRSNEENKLLRTENINLTHTDNFEYEQNIGQETPLILRKFHHTNYIYKFIENLHRKNLDFVEVSTIGYTIQGTPLKIIKIKSDNNTNNNDIIWIDGGIHAREWITVSSLLYIINEMINNRLSLPKYMRNINFVLMPIVNPDGYTYTHEKDRMWRKNRVETYNKDCIGIDLNRNWNYQWDSKISNKNSCSESYRGPTPNSELETKSIISFIMENVTKMKGFITFHSYGQCIMYPWAYTNDKLEDHKELHNIATSISSKIFEKTSKIYTVGTPGSLIYKIPGSSLDWMKGIANIKYVFALELRDTGNNGFKLPTSEIIPVGQEAFCAVSILAENILLKYQSNGSLCKSMHVLIYVLFTIFYLI